MHHVVFKSTIITLIVLAVAAIPAKGQLIPERSFPLAEAESVALSHLEKAALSAAKDLGPCTTTATALCLQGNRFAVGVGWRTSNGAAGQGQAVQLTSDSGYFWFFSPTNIELIVKVINACSPPFNRYWVFAAGLTNVEVSIAVIDGVSELVNTYTNPLNRPVPPLQDTDAFNTCP